MEVHPLSDALRDPDIGFSSYGVARRRRRSRRYRIRRLLVPPPAESAADFNRRSSLLLSLSPPASHAPFDRSGALVPPLCGRAADGLERLLAFLSATTRARRACRNLRSWVSRARRRARCTLSAHSRTCLL